MSSLKLLSCSLYFVIIKTTLINELPGRIGIVGSSSVCHGGDCRPGLKRNRLVTCLNAYVCYRVSVDMGYDLI